MQTAGLVLSMVQEILRSPSVKKKEHGEETHSTLYLWLSTAGLYLIQSYRAV